ncbi:MAG: relaxase/mobilization nuclease domain-containing protein [Phaeospirillum sp.]|nr:relaxase/mobilization nuclease domain-containing protein [Phaeospirillum sp.]
MIPKVVRSKDGKGSGGRGFKGAVEYISTKADAVALRNVNDLTTAPREMRAIANESRLDKPVHHFILSWAELERPTDEQAFAAADAALERLGMADHQAIIAIHRDRDHHHVHVVVNKRGLDGGTADLSHDYARLEKVCREVEHDQGWAQDRGHFNAEIGDDGRVTLAPKPTDKKKHQGTDRERHTGQEALGTFLSRDDLHPQLAQRHRRRHHLGSAPGGSGWPWSALRGQRLRCAAGQYDRPHRFGISVTHRQAMGAKQAGTAAWADADQESPTSPERRRP